MQQRRPQSRVIVGVLSLAVFVGAALTSSLAQADTGAGPYYVPPAWNRTLPSAARFMVLTNFASAAVLDRETGLVWEKSPQTPAQSWDGAKEDCLEKAYSGRRGWRLPSIVELASLIDLNVTQGPTLPPGHPFTTVQSAVYWSATTPSSFSAIALVVYFNGGSVSSRNKADFTPPSPSPGVCAGA
jgi:hypothetical protein